MTKVCSKCGLEKSLSEFYPHIDKRYGVYYSLCKKCEKQNYIKYQRTRSGLITRMYARQKSSSKTRGHPAPAYSKEWLMEWLIGNPILEKLFKEWEISGYDKRKTPSVDRIDNTISYTASNIRIVTWEENNVKGGNEFKNKAVLQYTKDGEFVSEYISVAKADKITGISHCHISSVCTGKRKTAGGYVWRHKH